MGEEVSQNRLVVELLSKRKITAPDRVWAGREMAI
jgi:hypothetical protein